MMTPKDLAAKLAGIEYPTRIADDIEEEARSHGLVIVFGASDDLMEFRGAIDDEVGAYEGAEATVDGKGLLPDWEELANNRPDKDAFRNYFRREGGGRTIEALWGQEEPYSWTFKTDIPHETFEIVEDGEPYCRGIVFRLSDVVATPPE